MAECTILKNFLFSRDGVTAIQATKGTDFDIPDALVSGLSKEGYVASLVDGKAISGATENKMVGGTDENKIVETVETSSDNSNPGTVIESDDIAVLREEYERIIGKRPFNGWPIDVLKAKIAEHKNA